MPDAEQRQEWEWGSQETTKSGKRAGTVNVRFFNYLMGFLMYSIVGGRVGGKSRVVERKSGDMRGGV